MASHDKPPVVVILQLTGGNDYMNTIVPYTDPNYYDSRTTLSVDQGSVLKLDDELGFHPTMGPLKEIYERGDMAVIHGVGYANSPRSHFRSMDIWHTCEPDIIGTEGWLGRAIRDIDPAGENPVTGVNIGQSLPRAMMVPGVSVASVADLSTYGLMTWNRAAEQARQDVAEVRQHVRPGDRHRPGTGLPRTDRPRRAEGRRHPEGGAWTLHVRRRVRRRSHSQEPARRGDDTHRRRRNARLLHPAWQLRYPRGAGAHVRQVVDRSVRRHRRLLGRPARTRRR